MIVDIFLINCTKMIARATPSIATSRAKANIQEEKLIPCEEPVISAIPALYESYTTKYKKIATTKTNTTFK